MPFVFPWRKVGNSQNAAKGDGSRRLAKGQDNVHFGIKELASGKDPVVDIVAIHGIDGDREYSWTADNGVLWLRDLLPAKIPNARILTYGYDANTHGKEQLASDYMHDHAITFIAKLALFREESSTSDRPIIFVAHSSGGILLKSALIHSQLSHDGHLKHHHEVSRSTHGIAFFGTPHQGSATAELARFLLGIGSPFTATSDVLLRHLERDCEVLQQQVGHYLAISSQYETKFFYELYDTRVAGVSRRVVSKSSAIIPGTMNAETIGISKDHVNMVRYQSVDDEDFKTVSIVLSLMSKTAHQKMLGKEDQSKEIALTLSQQNALSNLMRVNTARFDADSRPRCLEGTRVDLLKSIFDWAEEDISRERRQIFWLCGQAGTGKSTISLTVATSCEAKGHLGASFFFCRDHAERNDFRLVFPTLAQQLGIFHKPFQKLLAEVLERDPDLVQMEPSRQFRKLIIEPLKACDSFPAPTIVVIDALDECKDENPISIILSILSEHIQKLVCLKFLITSRPENHILSGFRQLNPISRSVILHEIEFSVVDRDIERYLRARFLNGLTLYPFLFEPDWPSDEAVQSLVVKSGRLFIFAATAMNFIFDRKYSNPSKQLAILLSQSPGTNLPSSSPFTLLDQLYLQVLRQAFPLQTTPSERLILLRMILGAIVLLRDPLSPGALEHLLALGRGVVRTSLSYLHSVIVVPDTGERPIRLIHPSFFDFVTTRCSDVDFRIHSPLYHEQLAIACFEQMKGLKRNICEIGDASKLNNEIEDLPERIERYISPALQYACRHWSFHLCAAGGNNFQEMVGEFCSGQILYWIEALSLLGHLRQGIRHLQNVSKFLNTLPTTSGDLLETLSDIIGFMAEGYEPISCASQQLYRSALPLSTPSSFLRKTFQHELTAGMRVLRGERVQRSSDVTIFTSAGFVRSVGFSPDRTLIVSASGDEVQLWDCGTRTPLHKLNAGPHLRARWADFFPDGSRIIAGFSFNIMIWMVATGVCLQTTRLEGAYSERGIWHYAIYPDFTRIVGSADNNIHIWRTSNGDLLQTLSGHKDRVSFVVFSPDHTLIASASFDRSIRIWNSIDGAALRTLQGHSQSVHAIAFSPGGEYIISGSEDNDIRLWDASNGVTLKALKGHTLPVLSVAFSSDGARAISGSMDRTLRVWDAIGGEMLKAIMCSREVTNVGFSPDGTQYISSVGNIIYIWDADRTPDLDQADEWAFKEVNFSPNGAYITGWTNLPSTYHIWGGLTGTYLISPESTILVTFSPNGKHFVSSPNGRDIWLWDTASRQTLWTKQIDSHCDTHSATFSSDSTRIVSASLNSIIRIWDVASGHILFVFDSTSYDSVSFSRDGSQIIAGNNSRYDIPLHVRPHPTDEPLEQLKYSIENEWIFASNGTEKERCVWIPLDWRRCDRPYSSSHGRVAIGSHHGLVLLDLSGIRLSI